MTTDVTIKQPIIVLGSARSGTTFLGNLLGRHPDVCFIEEPRLVWKFGNDARSDMLRPQHARPEVVAHIRGQFAKRMKISGGVRILEKTPSNSLRLDFVRTVFPDALFVHILRNGYDSALSIRSFSSKHSTGLPKARLMQRLKEIHPRQVPHYAKELIRRVMPKSLRRLAGPAVWGPRIPGLSEMAGELSPLEIAALQWRMCIESACHAGRKLPGDQYMEVRLEGFNEESLRRVLAFCKLSAHENVMNRFAEHFRPDHATARVKESDPAELELVRTWIEPTMKWLGYE